MSRSRLHRLALALDAGLTRKVNCLNVEHANVLNMCAIYIGYMYSVDIENIWLDAGAAPTSPNLLLMATLAETGPRCGDSEEDDAAHDPGLVIQHAKRELQTMADALGVEVAQVLSKVNESNASSWNANRQRNMAGHVNCGLAGVRTRPSEQNVNFLCVAISKRLGEVGAALSPFHLMTPLDMMRFAPRDGLSTGEQLPPRPIELVWQAAKIKRSEMTSDGRPGLGYFDRRARIYDAGVVKRSYIRRSDIAGAVFGWSDMEVVPWIPSRKFYASAYSKAANDTPEFKFLARICAHGWNLLLGGPDGNAIGEVQSSSPSSADMNAAYVSTSCPFGHERVLVAMLLGFVPWTLYPGVGPPPHPRQS